MAEGNEILIQVDVDTEKVVTKLAEATKSVAELKTKQKELNDEYKSGKISAEDYVKQMAENKKNLESAQRAVKSHTAALQVETKTINTATMSLDEQRQTLNTLQKAYAALDGEQRALADREGGLREKIKQLSESLIQQEKNIGDARRNVGFYAESLGTISEGAHSVKEALEGMGMGGQVATKAIDGLDKIAKVTSKNLIFTIISVFVTVLSKLAEKLKDNEKAMASVQKAMDSLGGVFEKIKPAIEFVINLIADFLVGYIEWVLNNLKTIFSWVDAIGKKFGKDWGLVQAFEAGATKAEELVEEQKKVGKTAEELHEEAKRRWVAEQEAEEAYQKLLQETEAELEKLAKKHEEEKRKAKEWWDTYNQMLADQEADFVDKQEAALRKWGIIQEDEYTKELQALSADYANKLLNEEEFQEARQLLRDKYNKKAQEAIEAETERQKKAFNSIAKTGASTFNALGQLVEAFGDDSEEASKAQKGFALAAIIANEAEAIASGVAATSEAIKGATKAGAATGIAAPFTTPAFIAEMVGIVGTQLATAIGGIVSAKSILAGGKFEQGGIVPGTSYSGDHVAIQANSGEAIITREQQSRLMQMINSPMQSSYESTVAAMTAALAAMPAPVMVYQEFQDFQSRSARYNEIAKV